MPTGDGTNGDGKHGDGDVMTSMVAFGMELQQHFDKLMNNADTVPVATAMKKTLEVTFGGLPVRLHLFLLPCSHFFIDFTARLVHVLECMPLNDTYFISS